MLFTKTWIVLLSVAATLAFGVALVAPGPAGRALTKASVDRLDADQQNAELMLRLEARDWIDTAAKMSRDRTLVEALEQASDGTGTVDQHKARLQGRLLTLVSMLKPETRPELVIALDVKGKQIYRMGIGEDQYKPGKDGLIGYPLVEEALRGGRRDDTWNINGKLYLMAASPVVSRVKGRYVGALLLGEAVNDAFARRFQLQLGGTDAAFFLRGKVVGSTLSSSGVDGLAKRFADKAQRAEVKSKGRSGTLKEGAGAGTFYAVMTPLPGEAGVHDAFYALIRKPPVVPGLSDAVNQASKADLAWGVFPWPLLIGALVLALAVGLLLSIWEVNMPLGRLGRELKRVGRGEIRQLEFRGFSGKTRKVASAINDALAARGRGKGSTPYASEAKAAGAAAEVADPFAIKPDAGKKGGADEVAAAAPEKKPAAAATVEPEPAEAPASAAATEEPKAKADEAKEPAAAAKDEAKDEAPKKKKKKGGFLPPGVEPEELATEISRTPGRFTDGDPYDTVLDPPPSAELPGVGETPPFEQDATVPPPSEVVVAASGSTAGEKKEPFQKVETVVSSVPETLAKGEEARGERAAQEDGEEEDEEAAYIREVYEKFIELKQQCGEDTSKLTLERFGAKLRRNRKNLIQRFGCKTVKFQVYVKDGKAALKATPIKE